jgi:hypothetical protein
MVDGNQFGIVVFIVIAMLAKASVLVLAPVYDGLGYFGKVLLT